MYINNLGHMTKMATMPIYGKTLQISSSLKPRLISRKLGVKHPWLKYYNVYINHDPVMTLTKFIINCLWQGQHGLPMHLNGKTVKMSFEGKSQQEIGKGTKY